MPVVRFAPGAVFTRIVEAPPAYLTALDTTLTVVDPQARWKARQTGGKWDGKVRFLRRDRFLTGLLPRALALAETHHLTPECSVGTALPSGTRSDRLAGVTLRPYQTNAVQAILKARRLALQCPTASGKTEIGAELLRRIPWPTLWLTDRKELLYQTQETLERRLRCLVGVIGDGIWAPDEITVAMVPTLARIDDPTVFETWRILIADECHHGSSMTWFQVASRCVRAIVRVGLSGTVKTRDPVRDMRLEGALGPQHTVTDTMTLAEQGILAKPTIRWLRVADPSGYPTKTAIRDAVFPTWRLNPKVLIRLGQRCYRWAYDRGVVEHDARNSLIADTAVAHAQSGDKVLVLVTRVEHGQRLETLIRTAQVPTWYLHGALDDRQPAIKAFVQQAGGAVLVGTAIFREGVNLPALDTLILAGGGVSDIMLLQSIGRALRRRPDKPTVPIYDVIDGPSGATQDDYLSRHTKARAEVYRQAGFPQTRWGSENTTALRSRPVPSAPTP
jgi:superfamily II DNA or RNA helicase